MKRYTKVPALTGEQLITLLERDGWKIGRRATHGVSLTKLVDERTLVTIVPTSRETIPSGTLSEILGPRQTRIGRKGLLAIINKQGLP